GATRGPGTLLLVVEGAELLGDDAESFIEPTVLRVAIVHDDVLRERDEMLQLVHERGGDTETDVVGGVRAARRTVWIGHDRVEDLTIVRVRIVRASTEVLLVEEASDEALRLTIGCRRERVDRLRHEHDDV